MRDRRGMQEPTYFVLAALLDGPLHGYAIIQQVLEISGGRVRLAAGTLYAALDRLAGEGLVSAVRQETVNGRARRYYALTEDGCAALQAEAERMERAARLVIDRATRRATAPRPGTPRPGAPDLWPA